MAVLAANLRAFVGADDTTEAVAGSLAIAEVLSIYRAQNVKK